MAITTTPTQCPRCQDKLTGEELTSPYYDESGDVMCDECHDLLYECICPACGESVPIEGNESHIFVSAEFAEAQEMQTGIFKILSHPWFSCDCLGMFRIYPAAVERVGDLPAKLAEESAGDFVCESCVAKFLKSAGDCARMAERGQS